jgi:hypothetical protein
MLPSTSFPVHLLEATYNLNEFNLCKQEGFAKNTGEEMLTLNRSMPLTIYLRTVCLAIVIEKQTCCSVWTLNLVFHIWVRKYTV